MSNSISNSDNVINSRDIIARIEDLRGEFDSWLKTIEDEDLRESLTVEDWAEGNEEAKHEGCEEGRELVTLEAFAEQAKGYTSDWNCGASLINDDYFTRYAQNLAEDIGAIQSGAAWPCTCIDWEQAASELQQGYVKVEFDGQTFWMR
jgi:hypothetical protein